MQKKCTALGKNTLEHITRQVIYKKKQLCRKAAQIKIQEAVTGKKK